MLASEALRAFLGARDLADIGPHLLVHLNIVVYALAFWMQMPVLPFLSSELGVDKSTFGMLQSTVSASALFGGPLLGRLLDEKGTKVAMLVSQGGSLVMYGLMMCASSIPLLFASRLPAFVQHAMLCAQAALSKLSRSEDRAAALGRLSLSYALGMAIGAPLGGSLAKWYGSHFAVMCSFCVTLAVMVLDVFFMDAQQTQKAETESAGSSGSASASAGKAKESIASKLKVVLTVCGNPIVRDVLQVSLASGLGLAVYQSMFSVAAKEHFRMDSQDIGFFMSFGSILGLLSNVFIVGFVVRKCGDLNAIKGACLSLAVSLAAYSQTHTYWQLVAVQVPLGLSGGVLYTTMSSIMSKVEDKDKSKDNTGTRIALSHATRSACGICAPMLGGRIYDVYGFPGFGLCAAGMLGYCALYVHRIGGSAHFAEKAKEPQEPKEAKEEKKQQ